MAHNDLLVGIVQLDAELGREDGLGGRRNAAIRTNRLCRYTGLTPSRDHGDLAVHDTRDKGVVEGDPVAVSRRGEGRVEGTQGISGLGVISMLSMVNSTLLGSLGVVLEEERCRGSVTRKEGMR